MLSHLLERFRANGTDRIEGKISCYQNSWKIHRVRVDDETKSLYLSTGSEIILPSDFIRRRDIKSKFSHYFI